jgi:N-acetylneuraminic acid mutarotase
MNWFTTSLLILFAMMNTTPANAWEELPPLPAPNGGCMAGCVEGKIIVAGGTNWRNDVKQWLDTVWMFDPATRRWSAGPALPHPLAYAAFASDGTRLFIAGGADGRQGRKEVYALDSSMKLSEVGQLPQAAVFAGGGVLGGRLSLFGGTPDPDDWSKITTTLLTVNLEDGKIASPSPVTDLPHGIGIPAMTAAGGSIYSFTGAWLDPAGDVVRNVAAAFAFDGAAGAWRTLAPYPLAARGVFAVTLDDRRIYLAGGHGTDDEGFLATAFIYDVSTNSYSPATPLPIAVATCLVRCGDFVYVLGGEDKKKHRTAACWRLPVSDLSTK